MEEWKDYYLAREENRMKDMWMPGDLLRTTKEVLAEIDNLFGGRERLEPHDGALGVVLARVGTDARGGV